jgi:hypothetical protein
MSKPDYKPALDAAMQACNCLTARCLIERIVETYGLKRRMVVTKEMDVIIVRDALAGHTSRQIALTLSVSVPTISAAKRRLGLTRRRKPLTPAPSPAMLSGVEDRTAEGLPNTP